MLQKGSFSIGTGGGTVAAAKDGRKGVMIMNGGSERLWLAFNGNTPVAGEGMFCDPGMAVPVDQFTLARDEIKGITASGTATGGWQEF